MASLSALVCLFLVCLSFCVPSESARAGDTCQTPNGETAKCISIYSCQIFIDVIRSRDATVVDFLRKSQCGEDGNNPLVCCGSAVTYTERPDTPTRVNTPNNAIAKRSECGEIVSEDKLLGGTEAGLDEFPWMALLQYTRKSDGGDIFLCGGTLIGKRYILTAAHCITGKIATKYNLKGVRLGEYNTDTKEDCIILPVDNSKDCSDEPLDVGYEEAIFHPSYNPQSNDRHNDIALIRLNRNVQYTDFVRPICLPRLSDNVEDGSNLTVSGWGRTETAKFSSIKLKLKVPKTPQSTCRDIFRRAQVNIINTQFCAGGVQGKDSCNGDSGGPLMTTFKDDQGKWYQEGVVSFGAECGSAGWPGVYTKVNQYLDWINSNVRD